MIRPLASLLLAAALPVLSLSAFAADARPTPPPRVPRAAATPLPIRRAEPVHPTPAPKKKGFFSALGRMFGGGHRAAPSPSPSAAPTATPVRKAARAPQADREDATALRPNLPEPSEGDRQLLVPRLSKPSAHVKPPQPKESAETPAPAATLPPGLESAINNPPPGEENAYQRTRRKAAQDPAVAALGEKVNNTPAGEAHQAAARAYTQALYSKMREIDPSQTEWFGRLEAATLRRIDAGKPFVAE